MILTVNDSVVSPEHKQKAGIELASHELASSIVLLDQP